MTRRMVVAFTEISYEEKKVLEEFLFCKMIRSSNPNTLWVYDTPVSRSRGARPKWKKRGN